MSQHPLPFLSVLCATYHPVVLTFETLNKVNHRLDLNALNCKRKRKVTP